MSYLFGNILLISAHDVWLVAAMDVVVVALGLGFYPKLLALCFDEEFAELRGVRVKLYYLLLLVPDGADGGAAGPRGGHRAGDRAVDAAGGGGGPFRPAALADDGRGRALLHGVRHRRASPSAIRSNLPSGPVIILIAGAAYLLVALACGCESGTVRSRPVVRGLTAEPCRRRILDSIGIQIFT